MNRTNTTRRKFMAECGALAAAAILGPNLPVLANDVPSHEPVRLKSWKVIERPARKEHFRFFIEIMGDNDATGYCRALGDVRDISKAEQAAQGVDLLDHEALFDLMIDKGVPSSQLKILDIACWDMHARMLDKPLHALLGTKKKKILRYGDVRGTRPDYTPDGYARSVKSYFDKTGLQAVKLHFPGALGTEDSISFRETMETLEAVRKRVGDEKIIAWDPYHRSAESATHSVEEAKQMIRLMDDLGYAWFEGPLPPTPYDEQIPKYVELMETKPKLRIQAEGPGSPIGDGTCFADMVRWVEAGAVNQCSTDAYIADGLTNAIRMMEYARKRPKKDLVINLHWAWAPHAHLVMAYDHTVCPIAEFPMTEDIPQDYLDGPYLLAPDWPGVYAID